MRLFVDSYSVVTLRSGCYISSSRISQECLPRFSNRLLGSSGSALGDLLEVRGLPPFHRRHRANRFDSLPLIVVITTALVPLSYETDGSIKRDDPIARNISISDSVQSLDNELRFLLLMVYKLCSKTYIAQLVERLP